MGPHLTFAGPKGQTNDGVMPTTPPRALWAQDSAIWMRPLGNLFPNGETPRGRGLCSHQRLPPPSNKPSRVLDSADQPGIGGVLARRASFWAHSHDHFRLPPCFASSRIHTKQSTHCVAI